MRTTINIQDSVIEEILLYFHAKTKTEAVNKALNDWVYRIKKQKLIEMCGNVDIEDFSEELKQQEILKLNKLNKYE